MEAADAGIRLICAITDGIPAQDMMMVKRYLRRYPKEKRSTVIGPNCAGVISPGKAMIGIMPGHIYKRGTVGLVTRSGTLGYEAASQMKALGIGITTSVGIGGDPINGSSFVDILQLFEEDPETEAVMMIGEIGGPQEAEAALLRQGEHEEAGDRLRGRPHGAQGPPDGSRGRDHPRLRRERGREGRDHARRGAHRGAEPGRARQHGRAGARRHVEARDGRARERAARSWW